MSAAAWFLLLTVRCEEWIIFRTCDKTMTSSCVWWLCELKADGETSVLVWFSIFWGCILVEHNSSIMHCALCHDVQRGQRSDASSVFWWPLDISFPAAEVHFSYVPQRSWIFSMNSLPWILHLSQSLNGQKQRVWPAVAVAKSLYPLGEVPKLNKNVPAKHTEPIKLSDSSNKLHLAAIQSLRFP